MSQEADDQPTTKRPYPLTYEKVLELHTRLDILTQELKGLAPLMNAVAAIDRRLTIQETSVSPAALMALQERVRQLELSDTRQVQSGSTWEKSLMWLNTAALLVMAVWTFLKPH